MDKEHQLTEQLVKTTGSGSGMAKKEQASTVKPILYMLLGTSCMATMHILTKALSQTTQIGVLVLGVYRGLFMIVGSYLHAEWSQIDLTRIPKDKAWWMFFRACCGVGSGMLCFAAIYLMPLSLAVVLYYTQPISAAVLSFVFNREPLNCLQIFSILSAMFGVILVTKPSLLISSIEDDSETAREDYPYFYLGVTFALSASVISGFAYLAMRKIGDSVHPVTQTFLFGVLNVQSCFAIFVFAQGEKQEPLAWTSFGILVAIGFFGWLAQEGVTAAVSAAPAAKVAPINFNQVVIAWVADVILFNYKIKLTDVLGSLLIVFFTFINSIHKTGICSKSNKKTSLHN